MLTTYIKTWLRNTRKQGAYSVLNIFGLAIGIACSGLIFLWTEDELGYDQSYAKKDLIYKIRTNQKYQGKVRTFESTPGPLAPAISTEIPGIASACRIAGGQPLISLGDKAINISGYYVDSSFLGMFTPEFAEGNPQTAFSQLYSIVITQKMAKQYFGSESHIVGKSLRLDNQQDYIVTGLIKDQPVNSTLQFDWFAPFEVYRQKNNFLQYWGANGIQTFIELKPGANQAAIAKQLDGFIADKKKDADAARPVMFGMKDWRLRDHFEDGKHVPGGRITYIHLFSAIAWIILLIACINFMNLATARSEKRAREVGVRKVMGAGKRTLIFQFIGESVAMAMMAVVLGTLLIRIALPAFNLLIEKQLGTGLGQPLHIIYLLGIGLVCGFVAGSYPALYLSSFNPVAVLKGVRHKEDRAALVRKGLVVLQFTVSIVLIISTVIIYQQVKHVKGRELGYNRDNLIKVTMQGQMSSHFNVIKQDLLATGLVENVATSNNEILFTNANTTGFSWHGKDPNSNILISFRYVSPEFLSTWGMQLTAGRGFHDNIDSDSTHVIITESFARMIGKGNAVGQSIYWDDQPFQVVGVIKDLVYGDMYGNGDPVLFFSSREKGSRMYIRLKGHNNPEEAKGIAAIEKVLVKDNPGYPFNYRFVDDQFNEIFKSESLVGRLSQVFAGLAILISCLGLFGLSAYTAERRTREIGIRKVLGASVPGITALLSGDFVKLVFIASLIAFPIAWLSMSSWLQNYAYRVNIQIWVFAAAGCAALLIALTTISFQAIRAARANPIKSLRSE